MARKAAAVEETNQPETVAETKENLVAMEKDGQTIRVCLAQIGHHQRMGWAVAE